MSKEQNIYESPSSELDMSDGDNVLKFDRFSAWGVFGLSFITLGIYGVYWLYSRSKVLNSFHENKINMGLLTTFVSVAAVSYVLSFMESGVSESSAITTVSSLISIVYLVVYLVVLFKFRNRLMEISGDRVGPVLTFFFSSIYLQYKINVAIDSKEKN